MSNKTLITGGLGYIGSHIAYHLGKKAIIIDNGVNSKLNYSKLLPKAIVYKKNITDKSLKTIFSNHSISNVIHLAGLKSVDESIHKPIKYYNYNFVTSLKLLEAMEKFKLKKLVFSSSATVYGNSNINPKIESHSLSSTNPYGKTKIMIENLIDDYAIKNKDFSCISLRYFNPIGSNYKAGLADKPRGKPLNIMPMIIDSVKKNKKFTIFGNNYKTKDGTCVRDYVHVEDLANAHLRSLTKLNKIRGHYKVNIGLGKGISILELIKIFEKANDTKINYVFGNKRQGDALACYANNKLAKNFLNWEPKKNYHNMCYDSWQSCLK